MVIYTLVVIYSRNLSCRFTLVGFYPRGNLLSWKLTLVVIYSPGDLLSWGFTLFGNLPTCAYLPSRGDLISRGEVIYSRNLSCRFTLVGFIPRGNLLSW